MDSKIKLIVCPVCKKEVPEHRLTGHKCEKKGIQKKFSFEESK